MPCIPLRDVEPESTRDALQAMIVALIEKQRPDATEEEIRAAIDGTMVSVPERQDGPQQERL